jgi:hypothetical protein
MAGKIISKARRGKREEKVDNYHFRTVASGSALECKSRTNTASVVLKLPDAVQSAKL